MYKEGNRLPFPEPVMNPVGHPHHILPMRGIHGLPFGDSLLEEYKNETGI